MTEYSKYRNKTQKNNNRNLNKYYNMKLKHHHVDPHYPTTIKLKK